MIFLDTSAIYALADQNDPNHGPALERFRYALESQEELLVHNAILVEAAALLQQRLGLESALKFLEDSRGVRVPLGPPYRTEARTFELALKLSP